MAGAAPQFNPKLTSLLRQATLLRQSGRVTDTIPLLVQASRLAPRNAHLQHDLGLAHLQTGAPDAALPCLERAISLDPQFGHAHFRRGLALEALARPAAQAEASYQAAIGLAPEIAEAHARLAALRQVAGRRLDAVIMYREAARRTRDSKLSCMYRARAALLEQDLDGAETLLRQVILVDPDFASALGLLAYIETARGRFAQAETLLEDALRRKPREVGLFYDLVQTRRITAADGGLFARMQAAAADRHTPTMRARLHLAWAKALDDVGDHAAAAEKLQTASELHAGQFPIDREALVAMVDQILARCTSAWLARADAGRESSDLPILVLGMPRSGTTLTEQILSSHSTVAGGGEVHFWEARGRSFLAGAEGDADLRAMAAAYLARLRSVSATSARVVDKNPFNFMWSALAHAVFPNARIVHCRRHPADNALSIMLADLAPQPLFSNAKDDLLFYYRHYLRVMAHMRAVLPAERFIDLDYEALVQEPRPQIERLLAFCGLDWEEDCLFPERNRRTVQTASVWQARQPIFRTSAGRRRHYAALLAPFEALSGADID